eukprot:GEZU01021247.1.p1 GENE.GEZU01021247.1~~GEZU01021247.1.p1  ORF type:complete len:504 (+),score=151.96 GEZU01021247.1:81-1592(+)
MTTNNNNIDDLFNKAKTFVASSAAVKAITNEDKLRMYGLLKQATEGPNNTSQPSGSDFVNKLKWEAWKNCGAMSKNEAKKHYVDMVNRLVPDWRQQSAEETLSDDGILPIKRTIFEKEHEGFRRRVRAFLEREVVPYHEQWEKDGIVPREIWLKAAKEGLVAFNIPKEWGGRGITDYRYNVIIAEEAERLGTTGLLIGLGTDIVVPYFIKYTTEEQKKRWLPKIASGEYITAIAMSEPSTGSDVAGVSTTAVKSKDGSHYILNGRKMWISSGIMNDLVIVVAKTNPDAGHKGISLLVVERGMPGYERVKKLSKIGFHARDVAELAFNNVKVPVENLLGKEGEGFAYLMENLPQERLGIAMDAIAAAKYAFHQTLQYCKKRKAFGRALGDFQYIGFKLAELKTQIQVGQVFVDKCIMDHVQGKLDLETACMAKLWCSDLQCKVLDECVQLHGGYGYITDIPYDQPDAKFSIGKAFVNARVQRIYGGSNEIMKSVIARSMGFSKM